MLIVARRKDERINIGDDIVITVVRTGTHVVRIGIDAPEGVKVLRDELDPNSPARRINTDGVPHNCDHRVGRMDAVGR